jgi:hypothetical protein
MLYRLYRCSILTACLGLLLHGCVSLPDSPEPLKIPPRVQTAPGASQLQKKLNDADEGQREDIIYQEVISGNIPYFLRAQVPVRFLSKTRSGRTKTVVIWSLPDYISLGNDQDFVRVPMSSVTAQKLADYFEMMLPTAKIVDVLYQTAKVQLRPQTFRPSPSMVRTSEFYKHQELIQKQLGNKAPMKLVAGHKKDIVLTNKIATRPDKIAIYGWHQSGGQPIQPLSTVHGYWYADYSHGLRLIAPFAKIGDEMYRLSDVLRDPELAPLLSYEGPLTILRYPTENLSLNRKWWPQS